MSASGSNSEVGARNRHVRFPPVSDRTADIAGGPFRARSRHCALPYLLHLALEREYFRRVRTAGGCGLPLRPTEPVLSARTINEKGYEFPPLHCCPLSVQFAPAMSLPLSSLRSKIARPQTG